MKVYHILMFLLAFNATVFIVQSIGIYDLSLSSSWSNQSGFSFSGVLFDIGIIRVPLSALTVGAVFAAVVFVLGFSVATNRTTLINAVGWGVFSVAFWFLYQKAMDTFNGVIAISSSFDPNVGMVLTMMYMAITSIIGILFIVGLMQMITGAGWKSYV